MKIINKLIFTINDKIERKKKEHELSISPEEVSLWEIRNQNFDFDAW